MREGADQLACGDCFRVFLCPNHYRFKKADLFSCSEAGSRQVELWVEEVFQGLATDLSQVLFSSPLMWDHRIVRERLEKNAKKRFKEELVDIINRQKLQDHLFIKNDFYFNNYAR